MSTTTWSDKKQKVDRSVRPWWWHTIKNIFHTIKNIFPTSYHGARTLTTCRVIFFFFLPFCWTAPHNISTGSTACFTKKPSTVDAPLFATRVVSFILVNILVITDGKRVLQLCNIFCVSAITLLKIESYGCCQPFAWLRKQEIFSNVENKFSVITSKDG